MMFPNNCIIYSMKLILFCLVGTFPEESKTYLRNYFITMLGSVQENSMRKHLNACIGSIIASEPPNFFPQI